MTAMRRQQRIREFEEVCRTRRQPVTSQRRVVLETVMDMTNHPTADQIFAVVAERIAEVSRTTVYRVLDFLVDASLVNKAAHPGRVVRYDANTTQHHHLICMSCDAVIDIDDSELDSVRLPDTSPHGFEIADFSVQLRGRCRDCRTEA